MYGWLRVFFGGEEDGEEDLFVFIDTIVVGSVYVCIRMFVYFMY